jgi:hypothetical protein|tara:strand:+ start:880 stop:1128 length:249 start_codon:yes stop_codon:yes gene_type:complete
MKMKVVSSNGYTIGDFQEAFDKLTQNMENWKMPIKSTIRIAELTLMSEACTWFTGSELTQTNYNGDGTMEVSADGYYIAIGA